MSSPIGYIATFLKTGGRVEQQRNSKRNKPTVLYYLNLHYLILQIFEKWRIVDCTGLTGDRLVECDRDREESNRRYDEAFKVSIRFTMCNVTPPGVCYLALTPHCCCNNMLAGGAITHVDA
jgi:hypothetical protein